MRNKRRWVSSSTMRDKILAFIILTNDRGDTGDGQEDRGERDEGSVLSDGTPGWKASLSEEDGRRFADSFAIPLPHPFLCFSPFLFLFRDFLGSLHLFSPLTLFLFFLSVPLFLSSSLFLSLYFSGNSSCSSLFFQGGDTTQLPEKTLRQFSTGEPISIIAGILHLEGENPLLDHPLS